MESTLDYIKRQLTGCKGEWPVVCQDTGLDYSWLTKLAQGRIPSPGYQKVETLWHYFKARDTKKP